jgi:hypothetical protein
MKRIHVDKNFFDLTEQELFEENGDDSNINWLESDENALDNTSFLITSKEFFVNKKLNEKFCQKVIDESFFLFVYFF